MNYTSLNIHRIVDLGCVVMNLSRPEFQQLTQIVQRQPGFALENQRYDLVYKTLQGISHSEAILGQIGFSGPAASVAVEIVRVLGDFGTVSPGREALIVFVEQILAEMGGSEDADFLARLIEQHTIQPSIVYDIPNVTLPEALSSVSEHYVFISYARPEQPIAEQVERFLSAAGFRVFRDTNAIRSGANWDMVIEKALNDATHMVLLLSVSSMPYRKEVYREWFFFDQKRKPIHPLYVQDCMLHGRLLPINYIDARTDLIGALTKLLDDLAGKVNH